MKKLLILSAIFCLLFTATYADDYVLVSDDTLKIKVYREKELDRIVRIAPDGYISFPLLGKVKAAGLTASELEEKLTEDLKKYLKKPHVTVYMNTAITVTGQVEEPGSYPLTGGLTVIKAIGLADGFTKIAARNNVIVMRVEKGKKKTMKVRVADISKKGDLTQDVLLKNGDVVFVPESLF
ncbi:polysaccharide biosynthesis/export family protein [Candidatus Omnitrophota bacterium]